MKGYVEGKKRSRGRPRNTYFQQIMNDINCGNYKALKEKEGPIWKNATAKWQLANAGKMANLIIEHKRRTF